MPLGRRVGLTLNTPDRSLTSQRVAGSADRHLAGAERVAVVLSDAARSSGDSIGLGFRHQEFIALARAAGAEVVSLVRSSRRQSHPAHYLGSGKLEELRALVARECLGLVLFASNPTPVQERNLEHVLGCRVLGRTGLILDIFAQRAQSYEGRLQVELAQLQHLSTRLVRTWTHLERQRGGIGLRGPGETQLESDRRIMRQRIRQLRSQQRKLSSRRALGRRSRHKAGQVLVSLVGYTNAGKSTLFNAMTGARVLSVDSLFATLDTKMRRAHAGTGCDFLLADTVGFIEDLPYELMDAFQSTLEEGLVANLLLQLIDVSHPEHALMDVSVDVILEQIGAEQIPRLRVFNKIDSIGAEPKIVRGATGVPVAVWLSARTGSGMDLLFQALRERLAESWVERWLTLAADSGAARAHLYRANAVLAEQVDDAGLVQLHIRIPKLGWERFCSDFGGDTGLVQGL